MNSLEAMLFHSASMMGASMDADVITGLATEMAPTLMRHIPYDALDAVYTRLLTDMLADPSKPSVMATAHDFLSTWHILQAEMEAARKEDAERMMRDYKAQVQEELRKMPRQVQNISDLAKRDGVVLPWKPGVTGTVTEPVGSARSGNYVEELEKAANDMLMAQQQAREAANLEAWHKLAAEQERLASKTERGEEDGQE